MIVDIMGLMGSKFPRVPFWCWKMVTKHVVQFGTEHFEDKENKFVYTYTGE
jgi:hypothetical protein